MTLKERLYEERKHWNMKERLERMRKNETEDDKRMYMFFQICEYLENTFDLSDISLPDYESVFNYIEKNNVNVLSIIKPYKYNFFKSNILSQEMIVPPCIGKAPDKIYDLSNIDDYNEFMKKKRAEVKKEREEKRRLKSN